MIPVGGPNIEIQFLRIPPVAKKYPFRGKGIYKITGRVIEEFNFLSIETISMERMSYVPDPRFDPTYNRKVDLG